MRILSRICQLGITSIDNVVNKDYNGYIRKVEIYQIFISNFNQYEIRTL
jgi:hypothetical protein